MGKIQLLDNIMIDQIAAGEVVERPASVVKELTENALDAGAGSVTVEIKDGGISYIRVTDNGAGIAPEELRTAFTRHATSKIASMDDLVNVRTMGFRGEALSSIASVSRLEAVTKTAGSRLGQRIELHGGEVVSQKETACPDGSSFVVHDLFYNTPARRKFLKRAPAEAGAVVDVVNRMALGRPEVAFKLINNGATLFQTKGDGDGIAVVLAVYGRDIARKLIPAACARNGFSVSGLVGRPELARANRSYEHFYINGRCVRSEAVRRAAEDAYKTRLPVGRFPVFILRLESAPDFVDVNVHPAKLEVRFGDEDIVYDLIFAAVSSALAGENLIPSQRAEEIFKVPTAAATSWEQLGTGAATATLSGGDIPDLGLGLDLGLDYERAPADIMVAEDAAPFTVYDPTKGMPDITYVTLPPMGGDEPAHNPAPEPAATEIAQESGPAKSLPFFHSYHIIGQVFATYWIVEQGGSIYLIDQHAAHERVLFEEINAKLRARATVSQPLVTPIALSLTERELNVLRENLELFAAFGFELEELGERVYALRAVPFIFNSPGNAAFFMEILDKLADSRHISGVYDERMDAVATMSCKAAVKAHDRLSYAEAKALIGRALELENPFTCPHGRPTIIEISKYQIEKMFKRVM